MRVSRNAGHDRSAAARPWNLSEGEVRQTRPLSSRLVISTLVAAGEIARTPAGTVTAVAKLMVMPL